MNSDWFNHAAVVLPGLIVLTAKATAAMAIALVLVGAMRRAMAGARHLMLAGTLTVVLFMPLMATLLPGLNVAGRWLNPVKVEVRQAIPSGTEGATAPTDMRAVGGSVRHENAVEISSTQVQEPVAVSVRISSRSAPLEDTRLRNWSACLAIVWLGGLAVALTPLVMSRIALFGVSRRCSEVDDPQWRSLLAALSGRLSLNRSVRLLVHDDVGMPMTWGILRPVVLLPAACNEWPQSRRRIVLLHELAHVKRLDCLWLLVGKLARAVHWFNPLAWWCVARLRTEAERACDERVLAAGESGPEYAEQLLAIVASLGGRPVSDVLALGMARRSTLETRLRSILENSRVLRGLTTRRAVAMVVGLAAIALPLSMLRVAAQTQPAPRKIIVEVVSADDLPRASAYVSEKLSLQSAATTDAGGRCEISVNDPGVSRWLASWPGSSTCAVFTVPSGKTEAPVVVKLESPLGHLYQRVTDGQGHGVSGVSVAARLTLADGGSIEAPPQMTDAAGYCDFGLIPMIRGGSIRTALSKGGSYRWSPPIPLPTHGREIFLPDLVDKLATSHAEKPAWASIGGSVRGEDGKPVAEAEVRLVWKTPSEMGVRDRIAVTDASGRWTTLLPPDGQIQHLEVWHPQFVIESMSIGSSGPSPDQMRAGTAVTVLHRGVPLDGIVRDEKGSPVPDVLILTRWEMSIGMSGPVEDHSMGHTGKDGKFHVGSLDPGPRRLSTFSNQYLSVTADVNVQPGMKPVELTVSKGGSVTGVVLDREGNPVAGANVTASSIAPDLTDGGPPQPRRRAVTEAGGHFRLDLLPRDKPFNLIAATSLGASGEYRGATVQDVPYLITLSPRAGGGGGNLVTVLDDATGMPVTRYRLFDGPQFAEGGPAEFSQGLRFTVDSANGTYTRRAGYRERPIGLALRVIADGYFPAESPTVPGGESKPFVMRLKKGKPVGGTVVDAEGKPVGGAQVAWVAPDRQAFIDANGNMSDRYLASPEVIVKSATDGHFEFPPGMPAGAVVAAGATGYAQVASSEFHDGTAIKLSPWARVPGRLRIGARSPANLGLQVLPLDPQVRSKVNPIRWMISTRPRPDGTFVFEHLPAIPMAVGIVQLRGVSSRVLIEPRAGQTVDVQIGGGGREFSGDLQFAPGVGIDRVPAELRPGQPTVWIVLRPASDAVDDPTELPDQVDPRRLFYSGTVSDGRHFTFSDVPPGEYVLHVKVLAPPTRNPRDAYVLTGRVSLPITVPAGDGTIDAGEVQIRPVPVRSEK